MRFELATSALCALHFDRKEVIFIYESTTQTMEKNEIRLPIFELELWERLSRPGADMWQQKRGGWKKNAR